MKPAAYTDAIRHNLEHVFAMPKDAADWLCMLFDAIQVLDDVADGDKIERSALDAAIWNLLVAMPQNRFFAAHSTALLPLVATQILKWQAADEVERKGQADAKSFTWRAGFYDVVLLAVSLVHGPNAAIPAAASVLRLYGENFEEYMKEFDHA